MEEIPPVFQEGHQRMIYNFFPKPPLTVPVTPGETENFPRNCSLPLRELLKLSFLRRKRYYRAKVSEIARNARRTGRGSQIFIIKPETMEAVLNSVELIPSPKSEEVRRVLRSIYFLGKSPDEAESTVNNRTLTRHLIRAERIVGILSEEARNNLKIGLPTVKVSYQVLRLGRDALIDIQPFFEGKIF